MADIAGPSTDHQDACVAPAIDNQPNEGVEAAAESEPSSSESCPVIDVVVNNVVCSFRTRCHLDLRTIALNGCNVEYRRSQGMLNMKLRDPNATASIWSSGKITCTGSTSEDESLRAARRFARIIQKLGFRVRLSNYRIVNVLATCSLPFAILISNFARAHPKQASYEPELHPGVTYQMHGEVRATLKIFSTGSITVTAPSVSNVQAAIAHIFPLVYEFRTTKKQATLEADSRRLAAMTKRKSMAVYTGRQKAAPKESEDGEDSACAAAAEDTSSSSGGGSGDEEAAEDFDSDVSHD